MRKIHSLLSASFLIGGVILPAYLNGNPGVKGEVFNAFGGTSHSDAWQVMDQGGAWVMQESSAKATVRSLFYQLISTHFPQTDVDQSPLLRDYSLNQNYPNPFNPSTTIRFTLPRESHVVLDIYDATGRKVMRVLDEAIPAGQHDLKLNFQDLPTGIYYYRMNAEDFTSSYKMLILQ